MVKLYSIGGGAVKHSEIEVDWFTRRQQALASGGLTVGDLEDGLVHPGDGVPSQLEEIKEFARIQGIVHRVQEDEEPDIET